MTPTQLANWRQRIGLTQKQAAKALGVPLSSYCQWEQGRIKPHALLTMATRGYIASLPVARFKPEHP